jgi:hypothetical protein
MKHSAQGHHKKKRKHLELVADTVTHAQVVTATTQPSGQRVVSEETVSLEREALAPDHPQDFSQPTTSGGDDSEAIVDFNDTPLKKPVNVSAVPRFTDKLTELSC